MSSGIKWHATDADADLIRDIVGRYLYLLEALKIPDRPDRLEVTMDLIACHLNGTPLKLYSMFNADDFNLAHDVSGIRQHLDRTTGKLSPLFRPRFSAPPDAQMEEPR